MSAGPTKLADEILDELARVYPALLTRQELAARCPSAKGDPQKCSLSLLDLKTSGQVENVPKVGWRAASDRDDISVEDEAPRLRKQARAMPATTAAPEARDLAEEPSDARLDDAVAVPDRVLDRPVAGNGRMKPPGETAGRALEATAGLTQAMLAVTHAASTARNAVEQYLACLDDPVLRDLIECAEAAETAERNLKAKLERSHETTSERR